MDTEGRPSRQGQEDRSSEGFAVFWAMRNKPEQLILDHAIANNISIFIAYLSHRIGLTPNFVTLGTGIFAIGAFVSGMVLPADGMPMAVTVIFGFAALSYLLDCADGQLANATGTASKFGEFLDRGVDLASFLLSFGGFFGYLYRHYTAGGDARMANAALLVGFVFLLARSSRFFAWQFFEKSYPDVGNPTEDGLALAVAKNLGDHVASLFAMILCLASPVLVLVLFAIQAAITAGAYVRYFFRAYRISEDT
jgi:phosphatidylglycerophosphate synthase